MTIADVIIWRIRAASDGHFHAYEERLPMPAHRIAEAEHVGPPSGRKPPLPRLETSQLFVEITTDAGISGWWGPIPAVQALTIDQQLRPFLCGKDPRQVTALWERMMGQSWGGRGGDWSFAIGCIDCALWDLRGRMLGQPVHRLLGGPSRPDIPCCYVGLCLSSEAGAVADRVRTAVADGFRAIKWFTRRGPAAGDVAIRETQELFQAVIQAAGSDVPVALDAWTSWDADYAIRASRALEPLHLAWLEEVLPVDDAAGYRRLRQNTRLPLAAGEHTVTLGAAQQLIDLGVLDYLQVDPVWCGGVTATLRHAALAEAAGLPLLPHGCNPATIQVCASLPRTLVPQMSWVPFCVERDFNALAQVPVPRCGALPIPDSPGMGIDMDASKVQERERIRYPA
jgi:L-alanine-DL-glutamate epimerase-like enolase superfamily enzyme